MELLLVEDDKMIVKGLNYLLEKEGYKVKVACSIKEATEKLGGADIIILDVTLPDGNGFDFFKEKIKDKGIPVIFLTAKDDEEDIVRGLMIGASDYMTKPFFKRELLLRLEKIAVKIKEKNVATIGNISFDFDKKMAYEKDKPVELTHLETELLEVLFINRGVVMTKDRLASYVYDLTGNFVTDNAITVYINRIRKKFCDELIVTKKGIGYFIDDEK